MRRKYRKGSKGRFQSRYINEIRVWWTAMHETMCGPELRFLAVNGKHQFLGQVRPRLYRSGLARCSLRFSPFSTGTLD